MRIELICTGDELTTGLTVDTNSAFSLSKLFHELGQKAERVTVVGDDRDVICGALRAASERSDVVLVCGGLGPTTDDLTAECAANVGNVPLVENAEVMERMRQRFAKHNIELTPNNVRQARVPADAEVVVNPVGTAPMFIQRIGQATFFYLPGVPREYKHLVEHEVLPRLRAMLEREPGRVYRAFRLLKTVGLPESHLDARVAPLAKVHPKVVFGFRTHAPENHLKLMAEGHTQAEADEALRAAEGAARQVLAQWLFGADDASFAQSVGALLRSQQLTLALAESLTGGMAAELLTDAAGASEYFVGSAVTYQDRLKHQWAGVAEETLARHGAVSEPVAREMAEGIRRATGAQIGLSATGYAGPGGGTDENPVGTFFCALADGRRTVCEKRRVAGDRHRVRQFAAHHLLDLLRRHLTET